MSEEELFTVWRKGWDSAVSVAEDAMQELMKSWTEDFSTETIRIPKENFDAVRDKVAAGLWKNMRIATQGGLDYYFAATDARSLKSAHTKEEGLMEVMSDE